MRERKLQDLVSVGVLAADVSRDVIDEVVAEYGRQARRSDGKLPPHVVVYLVMGLALFRGEDYEEVAARMIEPLARLGACRSGDPVPTASAITQARKRLGPQVMREVFRRTAVPVADLLTGGAHLGSLRLVSFDGTTLDMPDTPSNAGAYGYPGSAGERSAFPQLRLLTLIEDGPRAPLAAEIAPCHGKGSGERTLLAGLLDYLEEGMLATADAGLFGFDLWCRAAQTGAELLWRVGAGPELPKVKESRDQPADGKRLDQYKDLQKHLSLTLANATQSASPDMARWKFEMLQAVEKPIGPGIGVSGYVVMSNLMRAGDYEDDFLESYGRNMLAREQEGVRDGRRREQIWGYHGGGLWPHLNSTGTDFGFDPMTGYMKALSNSPDAATAFFNAEFIGKDTENNPFKRDTDGDGRKGHIGLSNFQYLFEERNWMPDQDSEGEDSIAGKNYLAAALEAATTGHPAGELPTPATAAHTEDQAKLYSEIVKSVSEVPSRLADNGFMSDSLGQISAEYMADIHRGLRPADKNEDLLYPVQGAAAKLGEQDLTRFMYVVGQNPEGYAALTVGQHAYTASAMEYHFAHPEAFVKDPRYSPTQNMEIAILDIAQNAGEIQGTLGAGRAYAAELDAGNKDAEFNDAITKAGELGESLVGIGVGAATASAVGPGAVVAGGVAETAAGEIIGSLTEGLMRDSSDEVIYRNGEEIQATRDSTFRLVEKAAQAAGDQAGTPSPHIVALVGREAEIGFGGAQDRIRDFVDGVGVPKALEKDK
ncbi:hypothetical protein SCWH03_41300 [Streptomyces pacificus]|uniref:Transposase IS4 N-terminal domain-containing protein n=1 Tax=Streptomyces pacificus TaxID=2705029 RepID=A0A6A0AY69_9ACTN|nr:hypothetical protein SCWH03_41300 [Streptomyces pacificus]